MYLKIVTDNETHYIHTGPRLSVQQGVAVQEADRWMEIRVQMSPAHTNVITLFYDSVQGEPLAVVTDGKVYLLDDSGKTVDVIQR